MHRIDCAEISKVAPDIILTQFKDRYEVEVPDVIQLNDVYIELAENKKMFSIINSEKRFSHFSSEALKYLSNDAPFIAEKDLMIGSVIVVSSLPARMMVNFFIKLKRHKYPIKTVSSLNDAYKWIDTIRLEIDKV